LLSACGNLYRYFPNPGSDSYKIDQAQACLDDFDFDCAIEAIDPVLITQPNNPEVVQIGVAAYSGRGGLRVLDMIQEISGGLSSTNLFAILSEHFPQAAAEERLDLEQAVAILEAYETEATERSESLNLFAFFLYYGQIGAILSDYAYDGGVAVGGGWDACTDNEANFPSAQVQAVGRALANVSDTGSNMPSNSAVSLAFDSFSGAYTALGVTKTLDCTVSAAICRNVRMLTGNDSGGIGLGPDNSLVCP
jgi:hypothetical protein